ncbi:MAG: ABC transporter ATP-binding protein [Thermoproteota archaeon]|nr:MAG: ABC transporter ATP-binding protein [Candidatus Korarchaeota archaeon]RLG52340.1 MAG: ABC transporter ATP-binding protein [Candidatus Korarchaeota archaeon]
MLRVEGLSKSFGGIEAVKDVSFSVYRGEVLGLIGPNGSGKTTLVNLVTGLIKPDSGKVVYKGEDITGLKPHVIANKGIARTFQQTKHFPYLPTIANVLVPSMSPRGRRDGSPLEKALESLVFTGLLAEADVPAGRLTHYQLKLLELARVMALSPELVFLDEVFGGLSPSEIEKVMELLEYLNKGRGMTLVVIEHKLRYLMRMADRVVVLSYGRKIFEGKPEEAVKHKEVIEAYLGRGVFT